MDSSDDSPETQMQNFNNSKLKRVTKIIDVSEGIDHQDSEIFQTNQKVFAKHHRHSQSSISSTLLYKNHGNKLFKRPGFGISTLKNLDIAKLPELNMKSQEQHFKRVKKHLMGEDQPE